MVRSPWPQYGHAHCIPIPSRSPTLSNRHKPSQVPDPLNLIQPGRAEGLSSDLLGTTAFITTPVVDISSLMSALWIRGIDCIPREVLISQACKFSSCSNHPRQGSHHLQVCLSAFQHFSLTSVNIYFGIIGCFYATRQLSIRFVFY